MVNAADRGSIAATLVFARQRVAGRCGSAPAWCVAIGARRRVRWRVLVAQRPRRAAETPFAACASCWAPSPRLLVIAVAASFRTLNGLAAGTALLVVMGALKLLESRSRRDDAIVIGVALFLLLAAALGHAGAVARASLSTGRSGAPAPRFALIARSAAARSPRAPRCGCRRAHWRCRFRWRWPVSCSSRASPGSSGRCSAATRRPPACRTRCHRAASASSPPNTIRPSACASRATPPPRAALYWRGPVLNELRRLHLAARALAGTTPARAARHAGRSRCVIASRSSPPTSAGCSRSTRSTRARAATSSCRTTGNCQRSGPDHQRRQLRRGFLPRRHAAHGPLSALGPALRDARCRRIAIRARWRWRSRCARAPAAMPNTRAPCSTGSATTDSNTRSSPERHQHRFGRHHAVRQRSAASAATSLRPTRP